MLLNAPILTLAALFSTLVAGRPLDSGKLQDIVPRDRTYAIVNVGGETATEAPPTATSVVKTTTTVEVVNPGPTVTLKVTATAVQPMPALAPTSSSSSTKASSAPTPSSAPSATSISTPGSTTVPEPNSRSNSTPTPSSAPSTISSPSPIPTPPSMSTPSIETPKPVFITVTVSKDDGPTQYYDDGLWHTSYRVKMFEAAVMTASLATPSSTALAALETPALSCSRST
ncbi:hypothetical protein EJ02DRAFT_449379 [Clathrospora elynae]|uniref:REJ domain-containing protein n=1 Tax=Clathrospora elynae TaxID=706981 RepID=A0A6A5T6V4_9PLEO|nr:hypothetical protein EJ02DRAFT_449379 [Clathrospora elynae]